ncbi:MAG: hypothetical protein ACK58T_44010, partial [Phycisphaerae bacterium]
DLQVLPENIFRHASISRTPEGLTLRTDYRVLSKIPSDSHSLQGGRQRTRFDFRPPKCEISGDSDRRKRTAQRLFSGKPDFSRRVVLLYT